MLVYLMLKSCIIYVLPRGLMQSMCMPDDTYASLFKALGERYESKRLIVDMHIQAIRKYAINHQRIYRTWLIALKKF